MNWKQILSEKRRRPTTREKSDTDNRNEFDSDRGRVVFSPAIRRMHDKTQVFPLTIDDSIHTRLTHSMEVSSVAESLGLNLISNKEFIEHSMLDADSLNNIPTILRTTALCHDIGNPPFGHFGERVIGEYFRGYFSENESTISNDQKKEFAKFDGNAQGFRVLTKTLSLHDSYGINLTAGTLSGFLKYPFLVKDENSFAKYGVFGSEKDDLLFIENETGISKKRNPLVFLMEAADDICFLNMDIEDGFNKNYYDYDFIYDYLMDTKDAYIMEIVNGLFEKEAYKPKSNADYQRNQVVRLRVRLIQELVETANMVFWKNIHLIEKGKYFFELIKDENNYRSQLSETLNNFCGEHILNSREIQTLELKGEKVLNGLLARFVVGLLNYGIEGNKFYKKRAERLISLLSGSLLNAVFLENNIGEGCVNERFKKLDEYSRLHLIVDFISGMTDKYALTLYQKISGITLN